MLRGRREAQQPPPPPPPPVRPEETERRGSGWKARVRVGQSFLSAGNHFFCTHSGEGGDLVGSPGREVSAKNWGEKTVGKSVMKIVCNDFTKCT